MSAHTISADERAILDGITEIVAAATGTTPEALRAQFAARRAREEARIARNNAAYDEALTHITLEQAKKIERLRADGARVHSRLRQHRKSHNVVIFLSAQKWNSAKSRMGTKFFAVYPDGTHAETFERTISVRSDF